MMNKIIINDNLCAVFTNGKLTQAYNTVEKVEKFNTTNLEGTLEKPVTLLQITYRTTDPILDSYGKESYDDINKIFDVYDLSKYELEVINRNVIIHD